MRTINRRLGTRFNLIILAVALALTFLWAREIAANPAGTDAPGAARSIVQATLLETIFDLDNGDQSVGDQRWRSALFELGPRGNRRARAEPSDRAAEAKGLRRDAP